MKLEMKVPSPGESITEVEIAQWLVSDGDFVEKDQAIAEVDSDKATLDLPAEASGVITLKAEEGDSVEVGQVVCLIDTDATGGEIKPKSSNEIVEKKVEQVLKMSPSSLKKPTLLIIHPLLPGKYLTKRESTQLIFMVLERAEELLKRMPLTPKPQWVLLRKELREILINQKCLSLEEKLLKDW